jgi:hypothetical protein
VAIFITLRAADAFSNILPVYCSCVDGVGSLACNRGHAPLA